MSQRTVQFLGEPNAARAAESFNAVAKRMGLPWNATTTQTPTAAHTVSFTPIATPSESQEIWDTAADVDAKVMDLIARLLGGKTYRQPEAKPAPVEKKKIHTVRVGRETAGRHGKGVTTVWELPLSESAIKELAATLKQKCGTGGTVKDGKIEIQGDHRDRITVELEKLGYKVKRTGG